MPGKPALEVEIDVAVVRRLLVQAAGLAADDARLEKVAEGWDCDVWRWGEDLAVRLPRRALSAPLIARERRALPLLAAPVQAAGLALPVPVFTGVPDDDYPWNWSVVPWIAGTDGLDVPRPARRGWAAPLAGALRALHAPAPEGHPHNPVRGVPLLYRATAVADRIAAARHAGRHPTPVLDAAAAAWRQGLTAEAWAGTPVWIHGDLHPGNLVADGEALKGIIDWGDVTAGDPAYDLAIAWLAFDAAARADFVDATQGAYDRATWVRARAWAAAMGLLLATHSDDAPAYGALASEALHEVAID